MISKVLAKRMFNHLSSPCFNFLTIVEQCAQFRLQREMNVANMSVDDLLPEEKRNKQNAIFIIFHSDLLD
jgi:hypothetical protein